MCFGKTLTIEVNDEGKKIIDKIAVETGKSRETVIKESLILRKKFHEENKKGKKIGIFSNDQTLEKEIIV